MAATLAEVRAYLESTWQDAQAANDSEFMTVLSPILSHLHIIEGAKTLDEQRVGCQQLSSAILTVQLMRPDGAVAKKLNDLRVEIAQFGYLGHDGN